MSDVPRKDIPAILLHGGFLLGGVIGAAVLCRTPHAGFWLWAFDSASPYGALDPSYLMTLMRFFSILLMGFGVISGIVLCFPRTLSVIFRKSGQKSRGFLKTKKGRFGLAVFLIFLSAFTYAGAFSIGFHSDDFYWQETVAKTSQNPLHVFSLSHSHFFRPLTFIYHTVNFRILGNNPSLIHIAGIVCHGAAAFFVFLIAFRVTAGIPLSILAAILFCTYPVSNRSVMWISGSEIVFAGLISLVSLYLFLLFLDESKRGFYILSLALFLLALTAHEAMISLAPTLVLAGLFFRKETSRWSGLPFVLVAGVYLMFQLVLQSESFLVEQGIYTLHPGILLRNYGAYVWTSIVPLGHRILFRIPWMGSVVLIGLALLIPIVMIKGNKALRFLLFWHFFLLAPYLPFNLVVQPRYLYLSSLALSMIFAQALFAVYENKMSLSRLRQVSFFMAVSVLVAGAVFQIHTAALKMRHESIRMNRYIEDIKSDPAKVRAILEGDFPDDSPLTHDHLKAALKL